MRRGRPPTLAARWLAWLVLALPAAALADFEVSGPLELDDHWGVAQSPFVLTGDIVVAEGVTLTVEPGVEVRAADGVELAVEGTLEAIGTGEAPIRFVASAGLWDGIRLVEGGTARIDRLVVSGATAALTVQEGLPDTLRSLTVTSSAAAVRWEAAATLELAGLRLDGDATAAVVFAPPEPRGLYGARISGSILRGAVEIEGAAFAEVDGTLLFGDLAVATDGRASVEDSAVYGTAALTSGGSATVTDTEVGGELTVTATADATVADCVVGGDLDVPSAGSVALLDSTVGGTITVGEAVDVAIRGATVRDVFATGISVEGPVETVEVADSKVALTRHGIQVAGAGRATLARNRVLACLGTGLEVAADEVAVVGNVVVGCLDGVVTSQAVGRTDVLFNSIVGTRHGAGLELTEVADGEAVGIRNNVLAGGAGPGVQVPAGAAVAFTHNDVWGNGDDGLPQGVRAVDGNLDVDPGFVRMPGPVELGRHQVYASRTIVGRSGTTWYGFPDWASGNRLTFVMRSTENVCQNSQSQQRCCAAKPQYRQSTMCDIAVRAGGQDVVGFKYGSDGAVRTTPERNAPSWRSSSTDTPSSAAPRAPTSAGSATTTSTSCRRLWLPPPSRTWTYGWGRTRSSST